MYVSLRVVFHKRRISFAEKLGLLYTRDEDEGQAITGGESLPPKASLVYEDVCNPYNIKYVKEQPGTYNWLLKGYAKTLVFLCKKCYPLAYFLSLFRFNCFDNSCTAAETFRKIISTGDQKVLCLPRSIFIATTSRKFKQSGALFIGVFLPSSNMHAWVIEDGIIADRYDIDWILYTPVSMMI